MILSSRMIFKSLVASVAMSLVCVLTMLASQTADARGSGGARSGFSRSSPASRGSFSSQSTVQRQGDGAVIQSRIARSTGGTADQPRTVRSASGVPASGGAQSAGGVRSTEGAGQPRTAGDAQPVSAQEMAAYRQQFQAQNQDGFAERDNWDERPRPVDPDYDVPVTPVVPAVVVGAAAVARNRADDYVEYVNTVDDPTTYLTEMPCTIEAAMAVNDVTYYRCEKAWYKLGYQSGDVVYIQTDPPPGY